MTRGRAVAVFLAVLSGFSLRAQCPNPGFRGAAEWYGGNQPKSLVFANINGDQYPSVRAFTS